jgi:hypothetical protein
MGRPRKRPGVAAMPHYQRTGLDDDADADAAGESKKRRRKGKKAGRLPPDDDGAPRPQVRPRLFRSRSRAHDSRAQLEDDDEERVEAFVPRMGRVLRAQLLADWTAVDQQHMVRRSVSLAAILVI